MIVVLLLALLLAQILTAWIMLDAHRANFYNSDQGQLVIRAGNLAEQLAHTPSPFHLSMVRAASIPRAEFSLTRQPLLPSKRHLPFENVFARRLEHRLGSTFKGKVRIQMKAYDRRKLWEEVCTNEDGTISQRMGCRHIFDNRHPSQFRDHKSSFLAISIQLPNQSWLNLLSQAPLNPPIAAWQTIIYLLISSALVMITMVIMVRRITRPIRALSLASNRLGRGEHVEQLQESGPEDIRKATRAFNQMHERLDRFIADRTKMLASLSHDLRTPITTLRLRIELLPDSPDKEKLLATLDEMQQMAESTLSFVRESAIKEESRKVSVGALVDSLCEDLTDLGMDVTYTEGPDIITTCRPVSMKRALRNLIENAVKYGNCARVSTAKTKSLVTITIDDDGPGISEENRERIFEPFVRLEHSRNRDTGGIGLGMAIARNIIHAHGGDIRLENRTEGGLRINVKIPL